MSFIGASIWLLFLLFFGLSHSELHGDNVCTGEQEREETIVVKHEQRVVYQTTENCWDITQGFKCKIQKEGTKVHYKDAPKKIKETVLQCCYGYYPTENETCAACEDGFYGWNCTQQCTNCTEQQICHHLLGCCDPTTDQCGLARSDLFQSEEKRSNAWMIPVLIASLCAVGLLMFGLIFYRKKYMKEKDPELPTLTYHPHVKGYIPPEDEAREFNNPLYRQSAVDAVPKDDPEDVDLKGKRYVREETPQNEYATLDEVNESMAAGPSSRVPLMHDANKYEVPNRFTPSPECRITENEENVKKETT